MWQILLVSATLIAKTPCVVREDQQWQEAAQKWLAIHQQISLLEKEEEALREKLIHLAGDQSTTGSGIKLTRSIRKGSVQYGEIPELQNVDLDKYRKEPTETWRLLPIQEKTKD